MPRSLKKHPGGRPTKFTPETLAKLEEAFTRGCSDLESCLYAGVDPSNLWRYEKKHPEFRTRKQVLKEHPTLQARFKVTDEIPKKVDVAQWWLEKKKKAEFGPPSQQQNLQINFTIGQAEGIMDPDLDELDSSPLGIEGN